MNYEFLSRTFLFQGTSPEETKHMLSCLKATPQSYAKGSTIWQVGDQVKAMGLVLNGSVHIENIDMTGNKSILNRIAPGQVFGETYACIPGEKLLIGVTAAEDCQKKPSYGTEIHPGKTAFLFFPGDGAAGQQPVYDPL